jgi:cyclase
MKRGLVLGTLVAVGALGMAARAQQSQQPQPLTIEKVKENLYVIMGGGGNTAAFVTGNGVVLVDTKLANYGQQILDRVKSVTDKPITHIINTHTHGDHVGSNDFFPASVEIVAHDNTGANMAKMIVFHDAAKQHGLPDRTFPDRMTLLAGNDAIDLYYFGPAHTNGDAFVVFRNLRVMHTGDAFSGPNTPIIDVNNGGSAIRYPETLLKATTGIKDVDTVIPGHSAVTSWQAFLDYRDFMRSLVASVFRSAKAGRTPEQALADFVPEERFKGYNLSRLKANIDVLYNELPK